MLSYTVLLSPHSKFNINYAYIVYAARASLSLVTVGSAGPTAISRGLSTSMYNDSQSLDLRGRPLSSAQTWAPSPLRLFVNYTGQFKSHPSGYGPALVIALRARLAVETMIKQMTVTRACVQGKVSPYLYSSPSAALSRPFASQTQRCHKIQAMHTTMGVLVMIDFVLIPFPSAAPPTTLHRNLNAETTRRRRLATSSRYRLSRPFPCKIPALMKRQGPVR